MAADAQRTDSPMATRSRVSLDELARRKDVHPVQSVHEMAQDGLFASDEDLEEFLTQVHESRHTQIG